MKKKTLRMAVFMWVILLSVGACAFGNRKSPADSGAKKVFTYAENQAENYPTTQGAYRFAELVKEKSSGRIEIQINAGAVLGDEQAVIEQMQYGGVDFARVSVSSIAEFVPKFNVLQMPYLYVDSEHMWKVLEGEIGDDFINSLEGSNIVALSWYDAGARNFYSSETKISTLEDMKGLNIRVQESELMSAMVRELGANPVPVIYGEVFSKLQMGIIDGAENNWSSYESAGHYLVAKYYTLDEHTRVPEMQICSQFTWDSLSEEEQNIIKESAMESALYERELWAEREKISEERVRAAGCEVIELSAEEKAKFQEAVIPMYEKFCAEYMDIIGAIAVIAKSSEFLQEQNQRRGFYKKFRNKGLNFEKYVLY